MKKAFTLIELLIVICILGIFSVVLFRTYKTISEISFRVERQKTVNEEFLFVSEVLQNFANRNSIDFEKYRGESISLTDSMWFVDKLYLSGDDGKIQIYSSGNCVKFSETPDFSNLQSWCALVLKINEEDPVKLTNDSVYFSQAQFKIIPYSDSYFDVWGDECNNYFACINDEWFWLFVDIYPKLYNTEVWANDVHILVQHFFNI